MELNKTIIGAVMVLVVLLVVGGVYINSSSQDSDVTSDLAATTEEVQQVTIDQVEDHNSEDDCWTVVGDKVYDITSYVSRHPGGDEILRACGEDGTSLFLERRDENGRAVGSGTAHSSSAQSQLEQFFVGNLSSN